MTDILGEVAISTLCFVVVGGLLTAVLSSLLAVPLVIGAPLLGFRRAFQLVRRSALFIGLLHFISLFANGAFVAAFRGRMYYAADPVIDWLPYCPFSSFATDPVCGGHLLQPFSETSFALAWVAFAVPVWAGTVLLYRHIRSKPGLARGV